MDERFPIILILTMPTQWFNFFHLYDAHLARITSWLSQSLSTQAFDLSTIAWFEACIHVTDFGGPTSISSTALAAAHIGWKLYGAVQGYYWAKITWPKNWISESWGHNRVCHFESYGCAWNAHDINCKWLRLATTGPLQQISMILHTNSSTARKYTAVYCIKINTTTLVMLYHWNLL
jgi:hypothetical protein